MGSLSGTCEIVESDELDSYQHSKGSNPPCSRSRLEEKLGKLPMLKTGRNRGLEDDLNLIFEAIDRRSAARTMSQSVNGMPSRNASKKPVRAGSSQASGIGISESVSLKQALRGLRISHASEMAAMKRVPLSNGASPISEPGALQRLYRSVVVEANDSDLSLDKHKGGSVEISLVPEKGESRFGDRIRNARSANPSAQSSPQFAFATRTKGKSSCTPPRDDTISKTTENWEKSLNISTSSEVLELDELLPMPVKIRSKASSLELVQKVQTSSGHSSTSARTASKGSKSASNSPRTLLPVVTAKMAATKLRVRDENVPKSNSSAKVSKSPNNSPRLLKPVVTNGKPTTPKSQSKDEIVHESEAVVGKRSMLKLPQKGKLKLTSNTIQKVLEIEEHDPSSEDAGSKTSTPKLAKKEELKRIVNKGSKSAGNSPRMITPAHKSTKLVKKKIKQGADIVNDEESPRNHKSIQKNVRKESASPSSSSRSLGEVDSVSSKHGLHSSKCNERSVSAKTTEKSRLRDKGDISQSSKSSSIGEYSTSTSISEDSSLSGSSYGGSRPHMSTDLRWDAIRHVKTQYGCLGLRNFKLLKRLGCGDIGTVYLAELSGANCLFALKVMDNEFLASRRKMPRAHTERDILQMLDHPFLPTLYAHFTTDKFSCLVMEYCPGGDLHVLRQKQPNRSFSEQAARFYVAEVLLALEYLHMLGVIYRDLKPENILVREDGHIMLSDFDLSLRCVVNPMLLKSSMLVVEPVKKLSGPCAESSCIDPFCLQPTWGQVSCFSPRIMSTTAKARKVKADLASQVNPLPQLVAEPTSARSNSFVGTHEYLAPEIIKGEGHGSAVDWWTFGIFLYELLFGKTPFKGAGNEDTLANVVLQSLKFPESPIVSYQAKDLIRGLLVKEPENRLGSVKGATEIKQHPFFEGLNWALIRCAIPPELPKGYDPTEHMAYQKEESKSPEFRNTGEHFEFELF